MRAVVGSHDREIVTGLREVEDGTDFAVTSRAGGHAQSPEALRAFGPRTTSGHLLSAGADIRFVSCFRTRTRTRCPRKRPPSRGKLARYADTVDPRGLKGK